MRIINERDRVREHIKLFVNLAQVNTLGVTLAPGDEVDIVCAARRLTRASQRAFPVG